MALSEGLRKQLSDLVATNRVVLFMKGTRQMPQCGLQNLLRAAVMVPSAPSISISAAATKVFQTAGKDLLRLQIDNQFHHELFFGPREPGDIEVDHHGLTYCSTRRAHAAPTA